jgi:hypothetical protein
MTGALFWTGAWAMTAARLRAYGSNCEHGAERRETEAQSQNTISIILSVYCIFLAFLAQNLHMNLFKGFYDLSTIQKSERLNMGLSPRLIRGIFPAGGFECVLARKPGFLRRQTRFDRKERDCGRRQTLL